MPKVNSAQWGDIAQTRQDRLDAFSKDLQEILKKHDLSIEQGEFVFYIEDNKTRETIGSAGSVSVQDASFEPYMHDFVEIKESAQVSAQNEPISPVCAMVQAMEQNLYGVAPAGTTLKGLLSLVNEQEQAMMKEASEIFRKSFVVKEPIDFIMVDLTVERPNK